MPVLPLPIAAAAAAADATAEPTLLPDAADSPRTLREPTFHDPPERKREPFLVRLNRFFARLWLFTFAGIFDVLTWPAKKIGLAVLPEGMKFYVYMWWITASAAFIWAITICEKLVLKMRAPRRTDVTRLFPLQAIAKSFFSKVFPTFGHSRRGTNGFRTPAEIACDTDQDVGNDCPFVLVHGLAGWGSGTSWFPSYWGGAEAMDRKTFVPRLGPMSSHHHRACELFAQLKGGTVDYGEAISRRLGHDRYGRSYKGMYPEWCATKPLHFVGHSMGGNTVRVLQYLMESGHFNEAARKLPPSPASPTSTRSQAEGRWKHVPADQPSACWVKSLTCISSPLNGTIFVDFLGLRKREGTSDPGDLRIMWGSLAHLFLAIIRIAVYFPSVLKFFKIDLMWDHWDARRKREGFRGVLRAVFLAKDIWLRMHASCVPDLSIQAAAERNSRIPTYESTYYFSYVTEHCRRSPLNSSFYWPDPNMHWLIMGLSAITGRWSPLSKPYPSFRAAEWMNNDGPVSVISQCYPFVCTRRSYRAPSHMKQSSFRKRYPPQRWEGVQPHVHAPLVAATFGSHARPVKGVWYFSPPIYMDHMTVTMAPRGRVDHHKDLYTHIRMRAREMSSSHLHSVVLAAVAAEKRKHKSSESIGRRRSGSGGSGRSASRPSSSGSSRSRTGSSSLSPSAAASPSTEWRSAPAALGRLVRNSLSRRQLFAQTDEQGSDANFPLSPATGTDEDDDEFDEAPSPAM